MRAQSSEESVKPSVKCSQNSSVDVVEYWVVGEVDFLVDNLLIVLARFLLFLGLLTGSSNGFDDGALLPGIFGDVCAVGQRRRRHTGVSFGL